MDIDFVIDIESQRLKEDLKYQRFLSRVPGESEIGTMRAEIEKYEITGLQYDKDKKQIKVYIYIVTNERQPSSLIEVHNNQTYIFNYEDDQLQLDQYDLTRYIKETQ